MKYSEYGKTGCMVSAVGFGGMRFDMEKPLEEARDLVLYAHSKGINYLDTAPGYCQDKSEDIFGMAIKEMKRDSFFISTKGMPVNFDTADKAEEAVKKSVERLGVDSIDFYHIWCLRNMKHYELAMKPGGQYEGLLRCKEKGLIKHIVCSSHQSGGEIKQILEDDKVEGVLLGANILNFPYRWDGVEYAAKSGKGIVAMNPLAGGMIPKHADRLKFLAREGETPVEAALQFLVACPEITVTLNGFTTKEHVDTACRVADTSDTFTTENRERLRKHLGENMNAVCTGCGYCDSCPKKIPIPAYLQFYNNRAMFNFTDEEMVNSLDGASKWGTLVGPKATADECIECGLCEQNCTQHLPIIARLKELAAWEKQITENGAG